MKNDFTEIARPLNTIEAGLMQSLLESQGIQVFVQGDSTFGLGISIPALRLMVPQEQASIARGFLDQMKSKPENEKQDSNQPSDRTR